MYRDDDLARAERIDRLEEVVARQEGEMATLRRDLADRDRRLRELLGGVDGRRPGHRRWLRDTVLVASALAVGAVCLWSFGPKGFERTTRPVLHEEPILADPLDVQAHRLAPRADPARGHAPAVVASLEVRAGCDENDPFCRRPTEGFDENAQKRFLFAKAMAGRATETELRMLKAICMSDGDRACRDMTVSLLAAVKR